MVNYRHWRLGLSSSGCVPEQLVCCKGMEEWGSAMWDAWRTDQTLLMENLVFVHNTELVHGGLVPNDT